jgi:hypothetical protein
MATRHGDRFLGCTCRRRPRSWATDVDPAAADQSALAPENFITLAHFSVSSAISFPKSAGEPASAVPPRSARRSATQSAKGLAQRHPRVLCADHSHRHKTLAGTDLVQAMP